MSPRAAVATRRGSRDHNMDAGEVFEAARGVVAAVIVDGTGNDPAGPPVIRLLAQTAVRIGATRGGLAGILAAAALIEDPGTGAYAPEGAAVLALAEPGYPTAIAWVGDSHAYSWDGTSLHRRTDPQTMGAFLRRNGDVDLAPTHDNWILTSLATTTVTTVAQAEMPAGELVLLVSDGLDAVPMDELTALVAQHAEDPAALAEAVVAAAREVDGYLDDATAVVVLPELPAAGH